MKALRHEYDNRGKNKHFYLLWASALHPWPVYCVPGPLQIHRVIPLTQIMDFTFLKICYVGAWKCQGRHPGSEIYWEFIDHKTLLSKEKEGESPCRRLVRMQPLFPISPQARTDIWQICIYMYLHRSNQTSRCRHNSRIQSGMPTSVSAVTNTRSPRKWRGGRFIFGTDNI